MTSPITVGSQRPSSAAAGTAELSSTVARRSPAVLLALIAAVLIAGLGLASTAHAADRNFAPRFTANDTGDIDIFGNTLMTCPAAANGCTAAQQSGVTTTTDALNQNNAYNMQYIDVDGDASTFNSSRSNVSIPSGAQVLFAGLYWGARTAAGNTINGTAGQAARNAAARNIVKFRAPNGTGYTSLTADTLDDGNGGIYQGFADVTDEVKAGGNGQYTVADVQASTGGDTLAGWSIVIAYRDTTQPARNLSIFDGIKSIGSGQTGSISVSGFTTPPAGQVRTRVGFVNYEGDAGIVGDSASLNGTTLSDAQHPATNFFNSRSSRDGVLRTATTPNYPNNLGVEQSILLANGILGNNATTATIGLTSSGDVYAPGVVTFATELYAPKVEQTKTVTDVNGGLVEQGDTLRYTITGQNTGQDGATGLVLRDPIPTNTTYVPGSIKISPTTGGSTTAAVSDATDTDRGEYDATNRRVVARLGAGSNGTSGGTLGVNETYTATFDVVVGGPSPAVGSNTVVTNTATASFASQSLGTPLTAQSSATATVRTPDLTITKTGAAGGPTRGQPYSYSIVVKNDGAAKTQGTVTVTDTLPTGLSFRGTTPVSGTGWTCTTSGSTFTCTRTDSLAAGASYPTITLDTNVAANAPTTVANTATVAGGGDGDVSNNSSTANSTPGSSTDLAITKTVNGTSFAVGANATYVLKVTNNGSSDSTGSIITDTLPAGLVYVSSDAGCTGSAAMTTVTCNVGALAANASKSFTVTAKPAPGSAGTTKRNTASVASNEPDPTAGNNSASASIDVKPVDLRITNAIQGNPAILNPNTTYTWQVGVSNLGGSDAPNSVVRFDVPAGTTVAAGLDSRCTVTGSAGNQVITCNLDTVTAGTSAATLSIPLRTNADPGAVISTIASVTTTEPDVDQNNNSAATSTPVTQSVDLAVTLTHTPGTVTPGQNVTLTANVTNNGPARPVAPKVTIPVPAGTTFVSAPAGCALNTAGTAVVCDLTPAELDAGEAVSRAIVFKVGDDPGPIIPASATVSTTSPDTDTSNDKAADAIPVMENVDLAVKLTSDPATVRPGQNLELTAVVTNNGPGRPWAPTVTIPIPTGTTFVSAADGCVLNAGGTAVVCNLEATDLDKNESVTKKVVVKVGDDPGANISATATTSTTSNDINTPNNTSTLTVPVVQTVDLGVTLTTTPSPVRPGQNLTVSAEITNDGAARPVAPKVTIPVPAGTTFVSAPAGCALNAAGTAVVCDLTPSELDSGEKVTRAIVFKVGDNPGPNIPVSATVSTTSSDTNAANDRATASVPVIQNVDLGVTLTSDPGTARPNENLTLTATIKSNGPGTPVAPRVTVPIPAGTTFVSAPAGCALNTAGDAVICDLPADGLDSGESLTRAIVVKVGPTPPANIAASATVSTTSTDTNAANDRATLSVPVNQTVDLGVTLTTTPSPVKPGQNLTVTAEITNNGAARPNDPKVTIPVPAGTTFVSAPAGCALNAAGDAVVCDLTPSELDSGEKVTRAIVFKVGDDPGPSIPVSATVSTTSTDTNANNNRATTTVPVTESVDLATTITASPTPVAPGENLTLTAVVTNNGPGRPVDPKVTFPIPAGTTFVSAPNGCTLNAAGDAVVCDLPAADLDKGESVTRAIVVKVGDNPPNTIVASATASTTSTDTNAGNDRGTTTVPVVRADGGADVAIRKTTSSSVFQGGDTVTYTLVASNNGPAPAANVVVTDTVPSALEVVSATVAGNPAVTCTVSGNDVRCPIGALASGADRTVTIVTRAKATATSPVSSDPSPKIKLTVEQVYETLQPGESKTIDVQCREENDPNDPADDTIGIASDGTLQIVDITTGQQSTKDVQVLQASAINASTYRFRVKNATDGTAQVRPHVTCLPAKTDDGKHDLVIGAQQSQTRTLAAGRHEFVFPVANGDRAIAPGIDVDGGQVRLVGSEPVGTGDNRRWRLVVDVLEPATVTATLRELDDYTSASGDPSHVHQFVFDHVERQVVVPAGQRLNQQRVSCPVGYEGIVASYDLPAGVVSLGNIPEPINRDFDLLNTTDSDQTVTLDLECIRLQTGDPVSADDVVNTAKIATTTNDANQANNSSSARILLERKAPVPDPTPAPVAPAPAPAPTPDPTPAPAPAPDPTPAPAPAPTPAPRPSAPAPTATAPRASVLSTALRVTGTASKATVAVPVSCASSCTGTATLSAVSTVRGTTLKKGSVLAKASLKLAAGKKSTVRLVAKGKIARALKRGGVKRAKLVVNTGKGTTVTKTVRIVLR
jgi:uncharacterized repeat protein (TIGR01451 family)/fimbrial isopeptide formation D2 family protein